MFKKWSRDGMAINQARSSAARAVRKDLLDLYPSLEEPLEIIFPKKGTMFLAKGAHKVNFVMSEDKTIWFFNAQDVPWTPTLRTLHKFPDLLPKVQVDRGAIKHVMKGSNIMCPGLTSKGGRLDEDIDEKRVCAVMAEDKTHAVAVGYMRMSTKKIKEVNKDIGVENLHYLNDGLWKTPTLD